MRSFKFWWFHRKDIFRTYQSRPHFNSKICFFNYKNLFFGEKMIFFKKNCSRYFRIIAKLQRFEWLHRKDLITKYHKQSCLIWNICCERLSDLLNSNICVTKIYWTKFNFLWKCDFKSDKDKTKQSLTSCDGIEPLDL